jgi:hypothetical protein
VKTIKLGGSNGKYQGWLKPFTEEPRDRYYSIPKLYLGETVFVVGGGPSIRSVPWKLIRNRPMVGCNDAFRLGDFIDWCIFADKRWWVWNHEELSKWKNREQSISLVPQLLNEKPSWLKTVRRDEARFGLSVEPDTVCWNRGCGGAAINVAYLLGAARIVLLGFDMQMVDKKHNWHDNHQKEERPKIYQNSMIPFMKCMSDALKVTGLQVANATPRSALDVFPIVPLEELLRMGW